MGLDPSKLSPGTFGVPELSTDGMLKITGVSKKALSGEAAAPKETTELVKDLVGRVKLAGSKTDATIQITREHAAKLHESQNPEALATLQKFVGDVKNHLIQREKSKTLGGLRVALSRLLGGIGKLEKLEKELAAMGVKKPEPAPLKKVPPTKEPLPKDFPATVAAARKVVYERLFPDGPPLKAGAGPVPVTPIGLQKDEEERAKMAATRAQVKDLEPDDSHLSTLPAAEAIREIEQLTQKVTKLQESIIRDVESDEMRFVAVYKRYMESCFAALVAIQEKLKVKHEAVLTRGPDREQETRAQSKLFPAYPELCRQLSEIDTQISMEDCLKALSKTNEGKTFIQKSGGKFFELSMDYDHPTRIQVIQARVKPNGKIAFAKQSIAIQGDSYLYAGKAHTKSELLQALKQEHGEPIDLELRAIAPTLTLRSDAPERIT